MNSSELAWRIRRHAVEMTHISNASHIACVLSIADILGVLYADIMEYKPMNPKYSERDRFILSKGHAGAGIYAVLAEVGFFSTELLSTYYSNGSHLSGHVSHINVSGVEFSTGSLGHGLGVGVGMAMAGQYDGKPHRIFVLIGDGECDEGSIWESALFASHNKLDNLTVIVDHNKLQSLTTCEQTISLGNLGNKWAEFKWRVQQVDGHDHNQLRKALSIKEKERPTCIIAHTIKGKGISFMENDIAWHYKAPQGDDYINAVKELEAAK